MAIENLFGQGLFFSLDGLKTLYIAVSLLAWTVSLLFAPRYLSHDKHKARFYVFSLITLAATIGVFAAGDLFTLFTFFEIMSLASYVWVAQEENKKALKAADTYMAVAVIGGLVLLMGILLLYTNVGTLRLDELKEACESGGRFGKGRIYAAAFCMFFGFSAKAGAFPIHIWLPKAHPVAPAPASALLSGVLTKAGIFGILIIGYLVLPEDKLWGSIVMGIGIITMVLGAMLAIFSIDIKRTLACSSVSQIGFIIIGSSCGTLLGA
ncbi:MAG: sodium:proton antiporter, partial [Lachnospiraceae bacterium]|nr:sodium:proton antiporter [Lachnospiraceae bacterium]